MKTIVFLFLSIAISINSMAQKTLSYSKLQERQGIIYLINSQTPFTGSTSKLFYNGQKELEGSYLKGKKNGKWIEWFSNGQKRFEGNYKNGLYSGRIRRWNNSGQMLENCGYINGERNGQCTTYHNNGNLEFNGWYKNFQLDSLITEYSDDGILRKSSYYRNGLLNGECWEEPFNGNRVRSNYKDGKLNGTYVEYNYTGKPAVYGHYFNDVKYGEFIYYFPSGNVQRSISYNKGLKEGVSVIYNEDGTSAPDNNMQAIMNYKNDKLDGKYISWSQKKVMSHLWIADESDGNIDELGFDLEKMEGCFIDGNPSGIFKYWRCGKSVFDNNKPANIYYMQIWDNGQQVDNGKTDDGNYNIEFNPDGSFTKSFEEGKEKYENRFKGKKFFICDIDNPIQDSLFNNATKHTPSIEQMKNVIHGRYMTMNNVSDQYVWSFDSPDEFLSFKLTEGNFELESRSYIAKIDMVLLSSDGKHYHSTALITYTLNFYLRSWLFQRIVALDYHEEQ